MSYRLSFFLIIGVGIIDAAMKMLAIRWLSVDSRVMIAPMVDATLHKNPGITFDIPIPMWIIALVTVFVILWLVDKAIRTQREEPMVALGIASIVVGATNNLVDRLVHGFTTDYLMFFHTSIINISDVMIVAGMGMLLWYHKRNPQTLRIFTQGSPSWFYVIFLRAKCSIVWIIRNCSDR